MTVKKLTPILAALLALSFLPRLYAVDNGTEVYMEDDLTTYGSQGTALDPDVEIKGFTVFGSTQTSYTGAVAGPGNVMVNGALAVSSGAYFTGNSTFTAAAKIFINDGTAGQLLQKSAPGNLVWISSGSLGDSLGSHVATTTLNMAAFNIINASSIAAAGNVTAARYQINGSTVLAALSSGSSLAVGLDAGRANTSGTNNNFVGSQAGYANTTGSGNNFVGWKAGFQSNGGNNNFFGNTAGQANTTGSENSYFGDNAGYSNSAGGYNAAFGNSAGFGNAATYSSATLVGYGAGFALTSGHSNTLLGYKAGYAVTTGTGSIVIGANQDTSAVSANSELNIGGAIYGNLANSRIGLGVKAPAARLEIAETNTANSAYTLRIGTGTNNYQVAVTTGGWVGLNQADPKSTLHLTGTSKDEGVIIEQAYTGVDSSFLAFLKSRGQPTSQLMPVNNDNLGVVMFMGYDGAAGDPFRESAALVGRIDGAAASGNMPGRLEFHTTPDDGSGAMAQRMVIKNNGFVGISTGNPQYMLDVYGSMNASGNICLGGDCKSSWSSITGVWSKTGNTLYPLTFSDTVVINSTLAVAGSAFSVGGSTLAVASGKVGIGVGVPTAMLEVRDFTGTSGYVLKVGTGTATALVITTGGVVGVGTLFPSSSTVFHAQATAVNRGPGEDVTAGMIGSVRANGTAIDDAAVGGDFEASIDGTQNLGYLAGLHTSLNRESATGGTVVNAVQIYIDALRNSGSGSITNTYGLYISTLTSGAQTNAPYAVYSEDAGARSYFAGRMGIGMASPAAALVISSAAGSSDVMLVVSTGTSMVFGVKGNGEVAAGKYFGDGSALTGVVGTDSTKVLKAGDTMSGPLNVTANAFVYSNAIVTNGIVVSTGGAVQTTGAGNGAVAGNARGSGAVDLQTARTAAAQVASGNYAAMGGGFGNTASGGGAVVPGGASNSASGLYSAVSGGTGNTAGNSYAVVGGGNGNSASGLYSSALGGNNNNASGGYSVIGGGNANQSSNGWTTVGGGAGNVASQNNATVSGGSSNVASGYSATIAGGTSNNVSGNVSAITGGEYNVVSGSDSVIAGGAYNTVTGTSAVVAGGDNNRAGNLYAFVGGGKNNTAYDVYSAVVGGNNNYAGAMASFVGGGSSNNAGHSNAAIVGGMGNLAAGQYGFVGGGYMNSAANTHSAVAGGWYNEATGMDSFVGGGKGNKAMGSYSFVGSGAPNGGVTGNIAMADYAAIVGGSSNTADSNAWMSFIGGGAENITTGQQSVIAGGWMNRAGTVSNYYSAVVAGWGNRSIGDASFIGAGGSNVATGANSTVPGGSNNMASGSASVVPGGSYNTAKGAYSFAAGYKSSSTANGTFTWADSAGVVVDNSIANQVMFKAAGGFWVSTGTGYANPGLFVDGSNNVGIGTSAPAYKLHVTAATGGTIAGLSNSGNATDAAVYGWSNGSASAIKGVASSGYAGRFEGNVYVTNSGANPASPAKLQVNGDLGLGDGTISGNQPVVVWLNNASGAHISSGSIVVIAGASGFVTTAVANAPGAAGIVYEPAGIASGTVGRIAIAGIVQAQCNATAALGSHVVTSAVAGKADAPVNPSVMGSSIGIWLEACTSPAMGRVLLR